MNYKLIFSTLFLVLAIMLCTACSKDEIQYQFPLRQEDVGQVIKQQQLSWNLEANQTNDKNQTIFMLKNEDSVLCIVESRSNEGEKYLSLSLQFPKGYSTSQIQNFNKSDLVKLFDFANILYGNNKNRKDVFSDFSTYFQSKNSKEDGNLLWVKRMGDEHYRITLSPKPANKDEYQLRNISIMNSVAYEKLLSGYAEVMKNSIDSSSLPINKGTIAEIKKKESTNEDNNKVMCFIVHGHLENVLETEDFPESFRLMTDNILPLCKDGYIKATLADETGNMEVFLRPTSLNADELKQERDHYIYFYNVKEPFSVVQLSILGKK